MNESYSASFGGQLLADDIAGIQSIYGVAVVPVPPAVWLFAPGITGLIGMRKKNVCSQLSA